MAKLRTAVVVPTGLHKAVRGILEGNGAFQIRKAKRGTILVHENDPADYSLLLVKGWVALSKTLPSGDVQITDLMLPGDFALVGTRVVPVAANTIQALSDIEFAQIAPDEANGPDVASARLRHILAASILTTQSRTSELLLRLGRGNAANRMPMHWSSFIPACRPSG